MGVKRRAAAALGYDATQQGAPRVLAAGRGAVADAVVAAALQAGVPVHTDTALAEGLSRLEVGGEIPPELYQAVAEVLAFLWRLEHREGGGG